MEDFKYKWRFLKRRNPTGPEREFFSETRATSPGKIPIEDMAPSERLRSSLGKGPANIFCHYLPHR